jgi:cell division protein FtsZ
MKINNPNAMNELENTPAYVRKGIQLKDVPPSDEATLSQFYVEPNDDPQKLPQLKKNNAFLRDQDKVD